MPALLDTMTRERAGHWSRASRAVALSFPATIHARQKGHAGIAFRGLSRGHVVCGVVQMDHVVKACRLSYRLGLAFPPVDWRRFGRRPFPIHVSARGVLLPRLSRSGCVRSRHTRAYSHDLTGANRSVVQSATRQHFSQAVADVVHFDHRLSSSVSLRPDQHGRSEKGWRYQISVMRCPK